MSEEKTNARAIEYLEHYKKVKYGMMPEWVWDMAIDALKQEPKTGHWKLAYRECGIEFYLCSGCNKGRAVIDGDNYKSLDEFRICPNCGAKMIEPQESEDKE